MRKKYGYYVGYIKYSVNYVTLHTDSFQHALFEALKLDREQLGKGDHGISFIVNIEDNVRLSVGAGSMQSLHDNNYLDWVPLRGEGDYYNIETYHKLYEALQR